MIDAQWARAREVLVVRLDNLGDVLVTTPAIRALRLALPEARITLLASPVGAQVGRLNPDVDEVMVYEAPWMDPWHRLLLDDAREQRAIAALRDRQLDAAMIFTSFRQSPLPAAYLCYLAGIPLRAAASIDGPGSLLTTRHKHPTVMMHEVERGLDLVASIGVDAPRAPDGSLPGLVLCVPDDARAQARALLARHDRMGPTVVVHPGCSMPARTYPWQMYAQVIDLLAERLGARVVLTGGPEERELAERVFDHLGSAARKVTIPAAGSLPFATLCAVIEQSDLTITNNTGPMHISAAVQTPVVALFALTNPPEQWGPWQVAHRLLNRDVPCRICYNRICPYTHDCLTLVTPDDVVAAAGVLLQGAPHDSGNENTCDCGRHLQAGTRNHGHRGGAGRAVRGALWHRDRPGYPLGRGAPRIPTAVAGSGPSA